MRALLAFLVLAVGPALAADSDFNGRWDITPNLPRPRGWWLELNGVGTPKAEGKFVSAYAGDLNKIDEISVANGDLTFLIVQRSNPVTKITFHARLAGGKLEGTMEREGQKD